MSLDSKPVHTGGCQCGAVRFRVEGALGGASICHCRMCQKAFGHFYAPLVNVHEGTLRWTKAEPTRFQSSAAVRRGFCPQCGTPMTYEAPDGLALAIGAFDDPSAIAPARQFGTEGRLPYMDRLHELPARTTSADEAENPYLADIRSFQHPDHEADLKQIDHAIRVRPQEWQDVGGDFWRGQVEGRDLRTNVSIIFFATERTGGGPDLHTHPYDELFVVREGKAVFRVGEMELTAERGDVLLAPAGVPHCFHNIGPGRLETTDIHLAARIVQIDAKLPYIQNT